MKSLIRFLVFVLAVAAILMFFIQLRSEPRDSTRSVSYLEALDAEFTGLVARTLPSVVSIDAIPQETSDPRMRLLRKLLGAGPGDLMPQMGAGVLVSKEGHIVTNYHVIQGAGFVQVHLNDGRTLPAKFVGADELSDIAILKIEGEGLQPVEWGNSDAVRVGQMVFAVGNPLGLQETVTQGIVSAKGRRAMSEAANEYFQTDAPINQGNSGGPLIDVQGRVIGINNRIPNQTQGIAFAIPSNTVRRVFEGIRDHGRFIRPWFGALMQSISARHANQLGLASTDGALVLATFDGSPAQKAGLQPGDVITGFNGRPVVDHFDLRNRVAEAEIGKQVAITYLRDGREHSARTTIIAEPAP